MACQDVVFREICPSVINFDMLYKCIDEQRPSGEAGRLSRESAAVLEDVEQLRLEYLNILRIDHVWMMTSLTKLSISNNMIEKIERLEKLVNLIELDLSFNQIQVIENLNTLVKLENLTLYSNKISVLENMDGLRKLHVFSVGRNDIKEKENVLYLRKFRQLRSINMAENPCTYDPGFRVFVATFLPQVTYYEYIRFSQEERNAGLEIYLHLLNETNAGEAAEIAQEIKEEEERLEAERHEESFVEFLGGRQLFDSLFERDPDGHMFLQLEETQENYTQYEEQFLEISLKLFNTGQERYEIRKEECNQFFTCIDTAKENNQRQSQEQMEIFLEEKQRIYSQMKKIQSSIEGRDDIDFVDYTEKMQDLSDHFNDMLTQTWKSLMQFELGLFDQLEEANLTFERNLTEMINLFIEDSQTLFTLLRTFEQSYMEQISDTINKYLTLHNVNESFIIPDDIRAMLDDKELVLNAIATSHDIHMQLIDGREDKLISRARQWLDKLVKNLTKDEVTRNRLKILEINHFLDCQRDEFENNQQDVPMFNADLTAALGK